MGVVTETYEEMEAALLAALDEHYEGGPEPRSWLLTHELYRQLDYGGDHVATANRAIHLGETPKPLYQLPVEIRLGAHHSWELRTGGQE
ncbi:MAG TPA: hypothetical protein VK474_00390 [Chthoniobacterales bacterium]|nr:hypothetical protein [Chthoniobacterales bacterium]